MTSYLPDNLLQLFAPRPPIAYLRPVEPLLVDKKRPPMQGMAECVGEFETGPAPPKPIVETREERRVNRRKEKQELVAFKIEQGIAMWNPAENENATKDPYKTLFVARINYETSESKMRREFEQYGKITKLSMVEDKNGKPRGYAFIEYAHKNEMSAAYKKADGTKIDGRRVVVDYERGRTQKTWLPRRLGGGKGNTRRARERKTVLEARGEYVHSDKNDRERDSRDGERASFGGHSGSFRGRDDRYGGGFGGSYRGREEHGGRDGFRDRFAGPPRYGGERERSRERRDDRRETYGDRRDSYGGERRERR